MIELYLDENELYVYRNEVTQVIYQHLQLDGMYDSYFNNDKLKFRDRKTLRELVSNIEGNKNTLITYRKKLNVMAANHSNLADLKEKVREIIEYIQVEEKMISSIKNCWFI